MLDEYVVMCLDTFAAIGVTFSEEEIGKLRDVLDGQASAAYAESPRSQIIISYESPVGSVVNYTVRAEWSSIESAYANWLETREPPYFGTSADARVLALADEEATPADAPVLDIGAGTGRNALALARRGHAVDAVEMTGVFAEGIREVAAAEGLPVRVIEADMSAARAALRHDYRLIVLSEVVTDFRGTAQLREICVSRTMAMRRRSPGCRQASPRCETKSPMPREWQDVAKEGGCMGRELATRLTDRRTARLRAQAGILALLAFALIAGAIAVSGASIVDAKVHTTSDGMAIDTFWIQADDRTAFDRPDRLKRLSQNIEKALLERMDVDRLLAQRAGSLPSRTSVFVVPPRVLIDNKASSLHTVIEINARDRPGLLYDVTRALSRLGLSIASAHITTYGERAVDVFYVKDVFGLKIDHETKLERIRAELMPVLVPQGADVTASAAE